MRQPYQKPGRPRPALPAPAERKRKAKEQPGKDYYLAQKVKALRYDYAGIPEEHREQVQRAALAILAHGRRAKDSIIGMGQELIDVKAILPEWTFTAWVKTEFELSERMAQNMMNVARQYSERPEIISVLNDTVLYLLSAPSTPESAREEVEQIAITEGKSPKVARVQRVVKAHKSEAPELSKSDIINRDLDAYEAEAKREAESWLAEEAQAVAEVEAEHAEEERLRIAMNRAQDEELTFAEWLVMMPADLSLRDHLAILELAKSSATKLRNVRPSLYNAVSNVMILWSQLITAVEKEMR